MSDLSRTPEEEGSQPPRLQDGLGRAHPWGAHRRPSPNSVRAQEARPGDPNLVDRVYDAPGTDLVPRRGHAAAPAIFASHALAQDEELPEAPHLAPLVRTRVEPRQRGVLLAPLVAGALAAAALAAVFTLDNGLLGSAGPEEPAVEAAPGDQRGQDGSSGPATPAVPFGQEEPADGFQSGSDSTDSAGNPMSALDSLADEAAKRANGVLGSGEEPGGASGGGEAAYSGTTSSTPAGPFTGVGEVIPVSACLRKTPWVIGWKLKDAREKILKRGLTPRRLNYPETKPRNRDHRGEPLWVVSQSPRPDKLRACGGVVEFRVSYTRPKVTVPSVVGLSYAKARFEVERRNFDAVKGYRRSEKPRNTVVAQSPGGGAHLRAGADVFLYSSSGPKGQNYTPPGDRDVGGQSNSGSSGAGSGGSGGSGGSTGATNVGSTGGQSSGGTPQDAVDSVTGAVNNTVNNTVNSTVDSGTTQTGGTTDTVEDTVQGVQDTTSNVQDTVDSTTGTVEGAVESTTSSTTGTVEGTTGTVKDTVGNTIPSLGGSWRALFELSWGWISL